MNTGENSSISLRSDQLDFAMSVLDEEENIKNCHFLDVVINCPKHIIKSILLCVSHSWHQGSEVTPDSKSPMPQSPIFNNILAAHNFPWNLLYSHWIQKGY